MTRRSTARRPRRHTPAALDVVGVGALNIDYLVDCSAPAGPSGKQPPGARISDVIAAQGHRLEWDTERAVDEHTIQALLAEADRASLTVAPGGSAFNTIVALARLKPGLRLGFIGLAGRPVVGQRSGIADLAALGVDHTLAGRDTTRLCGTCLALQSGPRRALLTPAGANAAFADYVDAAFDKIVAYLASARLIHVTSFLDDRSASRLATVLAAVRSANPATVISFDPGHVWSQVNSPEVNRILAVTDYLLVNHSEFRHMGKRTTGPGDEAVAGQILQASASEMTIVVKRHDGTITFRRHHGTIATTFQPQRTLPHHQIRHPTGAGDVFAAGLLAAIATGQTLQRGVQAGMAVARHKLRHGTQSHDDFAITLVEDM